MVLWGQTDAAQHMLPAVTATPDEAEDLAEMMSDIETYVEEMFVKFITGRSRWTTSTRSRAGCSRWALNAP